MSKNSLDQLNQILPTLIYESYEESLKGSLVDLFEIKESESSKLIENTLTTAHCYFLRQNKKKSSFDYEDLIDIMLDNLANYVFSQSKLDSTKLSPPKYSKLSRKAKKKFTDYFKKLEESSSTSGEGGELLLFLLAEQVLGLPQAIAKMSLKTSNNMHYHGLDGIHMGITQENKLALYYGESKIYQDRTQAITECLKSIKPMLERDEDSEDLDLLTSYFDLGKKNKDLAEKLSIFFDQESFEHKELTEIRALCLVGFNANCYETSKDETEVADKINQQIEAWLKHFGTRLKDFSLEKIQMNVFFMPFPCVELFRNTFRDKLRS